MSKGKSKGPKTEHIWVARQDIYDVQENLIYDLVPLENKIQYHYYPRFSLMHTWEWFFGVHTYDLVRQQWSKAKTLTFNGEPLVFPHSYTMPRRKMLKRYFRGEENVVNPDGLATAHRFCLYDVEKLAHARAQAGQIDGARLQEVIMMVKIQARIHGYLPENAFKSGAWLEDIYKEVEQVVNYEIPDPDYPRTEKHNRLVWITEHRLDQLNLSVTPLEYFEGKGHGETSGTTASDTNAE